MNGVWGPKDTGRVPLFDRLIDDEPHVSREAVPLRTLDERGLRESIRREIERLLETRCPFPGDVALDRERTALDYGLPDLDQGGRGRVGERRARLVRLVEQTVTAFEPRVEDVEVEILDTAEGRDRVIVSISAKVWVNERPVPVSISLPVAGGAA